MNAIPLTELLLPVAVVDPRATPDAEIGYVDISAVDNREKQIVAASRMLGSEAPSRARQVIRTNDVLVSTTRPNLNAVALVPAELDGQVCSTGFAVLRPGPRLVPAYLFAFVRSTAFVDGLAALTAGALYPAVTDADVRRRTIPLPDVETQRQVSTAVERELASAHEARHACRSQESATQALLAGVLADSSRRMRSAFATSSLIATCNWKASPSTRLDGDALVLTVTSGCLQLMGFSAKGLRANRVALKDVAHGTLVTGEVLVSRSNTEELVGRAALYMGGEPVVATDLTFRLAPNTNVLDPEFLARYLVGLQLEGYWLDRSSGASSTMKKITRAQLAAVPVPLAPIAEQRRIAAELRERLATIDKMTRAIDAQLEAIDALPTAILRRAFEEIEAA